MKIIDVAFQNGEVENGQIEARRLFVGQRILA
ncbi:hypothetical protein MBENS4_3076 [Novosphingobium sp. MBES04]|nr:hypothetical protein MBENS4_3076 [Novosphingobium sp. MBES04]